MKKIAIISDSLIGGGIEQVSIALAEAFKNNNLEVHLILLKNAVAPDLLKKFHIHVLSENGRITNISKLRPYLFSKKIKRLNKEFDFDIVLSNLADFAGMKTVELVGFKNLYTIIHNTQSKRRFKRHQKKGFSVLKAYKLYKIRKSFKNKKLLCVSKGVEDDLLQIIKAKPQYIQTIYNPFDIQKIRALASVENKNIPKDKYVIHVGRFELIHKRQDVLLQAYVLSNIQHKLVLLGGGQDQEKIQKMIVELGIEDRVILPGFVDNPYNWIKNAELFIFSSDYEGFGNVLAESLIVNTPVVSTNCKSGPSEILSGELSKFLVPVGDVQSLSEKIVEAIDCYPKIERKHIDKFSADSIVKSYIGLLDQHI